MIAIAAYVTILGSAAAAQAPVAVHSQVQGNEPIVVTANRIGVSVWRVSRGGATLVLAATIPDVAKGTQWNAEALERTISQADKVMFPEMVALTANPFQLVGWLAKWKNRRILPKGQTLSAMISPADRARLERLAAAKIAPADWDRWHPLHLGQKMQDKVRGAAGKSKDLNSTIRSMAAKHKVTRVSVASIKASPMINELFATAPRDHVRCLTASIDYAEGGAAELRRRSAAWASRQVVSAARSRAAKVYDDCWPGTTPTPRSRAAILASVDRVLAANSGTVFAAFDLNSLADPGGLLDRLRESGAQIDGPAWR